MDVSITAYIARHGRADVYRLRDERPNPAARSVQKSKPAERPQKACVVGSVQRIAVHVGASRYNVVEGVILNTRPLSLQTTLMTLS